MTGAAARRKPRLVSPTRLPFIFRHSTQSLQDLAQESPMHRFSFTSSFSLKVYLRANPRLAHLVGDPLFDRNFEDPALLSSVAHELPDMFSELMPEMNYDSELLAVMTPFTYVTVLATPAFAARFLDERGAITCSMNLTPEQSLKVRHRVAVLSILRNVYGMNIGYTSRSLQFRLTNSDGLVQNWDIHLDPRFYEVSRVKGAPTASERDLHDVLNLLDSPEEALKILQPQHYRFDGLILLRALENTTQLLISDLQHFLIEDERNIIDGDMFSRLCEKLRRLLEHSGLQFALVMPVQGKFLIVSEDRGCQSDCVFAGSVEISGTAYTGSILERVDGAERSWSAFAMTDADQGNSFDALSFSCTSDRIIIARLRQGERTLAYLRLSCKDDLALHRINTLQLESSLPLLTLAVARSTHSAEMEIESTIKRNCTAIHPAVEWKFRQAALEQRVHNTDTMGEIRFENVYPLFAVSDIRGSSQRRNDAIQADLSDQFQDLVQLFQEAWQARPHPIFQKMICLLEKGLFALRTQLSAGMETSALMLLRDTAHPPLDLIENISPLFAERVRRYQARLDEKHQCYSDKRRAFETSVARINRIVTDSIVAAQVEAQLALPHFFETQATDGVDHGIYVGQSLLESGRFERHHLANLRLWQLIAVCTAARAARSLKESLPVPLELAHLIVAHDSPITLVFSYEEKQFDIEGAYSVRYEILKKRIDKATIRGTGERITQPDLLAIIYSQESERLSYLDDLRFLAEKGMVGEAIEDHPLDDLQGIVGLSALRCRIL